MDFWQKHTIYGQNAKNSMFYNPESMAGTGAYGKLNIISNTTGVCGSAM